MAGAIEADILERRTPQIGVDPEREDSLRGMPELTSPCEHAATVDPDGEPKRLAIFQSEAFGGELRTSIKRNRRCRGKALGDALHRQPRRRLRRERWLKRVLLHDH